VGDNAGRRLGEFLRDLGFHYVDRHRSKSVDLFRQGRVNLVLTDEPDSAAAEHFQMQRPSVARRLSESTIRNVPWSAPGRCSARSGRNRSVKESAVSRHYEHLSER